jgi:hypothetical protein
MTTETHHFLPERLRPPVSGRRSRRGYALLTIVPVMLLALPQWRVAEVKVDACPKLPASAVDSMYELVGQPAFAVDLEEIRDRIEIWPGVGGVRVEFELPGTISIRVEAAETCGSVRVGRSWHGVNVDGSLTGSVAMAVPPLLEGFVDEDDRSHGLAAAIRLQEAAAGQVRSVRRVTPTDYRLLFVPHEGDEPAVVFVRSQATAAEKAWCASVAAGSATHPWVDLRHSDRMVVGGGW